MRYVKLVGSFVSLAILVMGISVSGCSKALQEGGASQVAQLQFVGLGENTPLEIVIGRTFELQITGKDANGETVSDLDLEWQIDGDVGTFDSEKMIFTASSIGNGAIIAKIGEIQAKLDIKVIEGDPTPMLQAASEKWAAGDLPGALAKYNEALAIAPSSSQANAAYSLLSFAQIIEDPRTIELKNSIPAWSGLPESLNELRPLQITTVNPNGLLNLTRPAVAFIVNGQETAINIREIQSYLDDVVLSRIDTTLAALEKVEADKNFVWVVSKEILRSNRDREVDLSEVYALDAILSYIKVLVAEINAYNLDFEGTTLQNALDDPNFGKLRANGRDLMEQARVAMVRSMDRSLSFYEYLQSEIDDQSNDIIPKLQNTADVDTGIQIVQQIKRSAEGETQRFTLAPGRELAINFANFYRNPLDNLVGYVGPLTRRPLTADVFPPDYDFTVSGLFPELTTYDKWMEAIR